ncbi:MAG TPA: M14 family metallocarboxypeptidase [Candidatus Acidoferrum sp.]|nr:M14 family metallocarboxypeptidase [Candidatus Acidoferrum sp.]
MRTTLDFPGTVSRKRIVAHKRATEKLVSPFEEIALSSTHLIAKPLAEFENNGTAYHLPRYVLLGPKGGGDTIRIGIFATLHGDEPEGALALVRFITTLEKNPELAKGYALFLYPICNPTGFEDNTRHTRSGKDLNREFWIGSQEPEIRSLETEIWTHAFHGIVTLHADDTSNGVYGYANGAVLSEHLLEPALRSAEAFLPRNKRRTIDGFPARRGIIYSSYDGALQSPKGLKQPPFEITLETPQPAPLHLQVEALNAALQTVLVEYRYLIAVAQNI